MIKQLFLFAVLALFLVQVFAQYSENEPVYNPDILENPVLWLIYAVIFIIGIILIFALVLPKFVKFVPKKK